MRRYLHRARHAGRTAPAVRLEIERTRLEQAGWMRVPDTELDTLEVDLAGWVFQLEFDAAGTAWVDVIGHELV